MGTRSAGSILVAMALGSVVLSACEPYDVLTTPDVHMRVLDARTLQPIEGATVTVTGESGLRAAGRTDARGLVYLPALERTIVWAPPIPMSRPYPPVAQVTVDASGYQPLTFRSDKNGGAAIVGAKPVTLMPMADLPPAAE
jgi:hypothetical protein